MAKKKENDSVKNTVIKTARYGSLRPNFPRDPGSISIRYGSPGLDPEEPVGKLPKTPQKHRTVPSEPNPVPKRYGSPRLDSEEPVKPHEDETIARYGCPPPEISNKPSKLKRIIEILKEKEK